MLPAPPEQRSPENHSPQEEDERKVAAAAASTGREPSSSHTPATKKASPAAKKPKTAASPRNAKISTVLCPAPAWLAVLYPRSGNWAPSGSSPVTGLPPGPSTCFENWGLELQDSSRFPGSKPPGPVLDCTIARPGAVWWCNDCRTAAAPLSEAPSESPDRTW